MQLQTQQYLNGLHNGIYLTLSIILLMFALSYLHKKIHNCHIFFAVTAVSLAFLGFGMFHIFLQQSSVNSFFSDTFLIFCAVVTPLSMALLMFAYIYAFTMRSYTAYQLLKQFKWIEYLLYCMFISLACYIPFADSVYSISKLIILSFIPSSIALSLLSFKSAEKNTFGYLLGGVFLLTAISCSLTIILQLLLIPDVLKYRIYFSSAGISVVFCFLLLRFGYKEIQAFLLIRKLDKQHIINEINNAVSENQFHMIYQPQIDIQKNQIAGVEAFIRWEHPTKGNIKPNDFIPLAEETKKIDTITQWVINQVVTDAKYFMSHGKPLKISINFSAASFNEHTIDCLVTQIKKHNLPTHLIHLEITEDLMNKENIQVKNLLSKLKNTGIKLSIDDYGTGLSSLKYLQQLFISEIKIDKSFIRLLNTSVDTYAIIFSTLQMSRNLGIVSVAEGVEDEETLQTLKSIGCDIVQGFAIARPMKFKELKQFLETDKRDIKKPL